MTVPLEIVFQGIDPSEAIERRIETEVHKLERYHQRITACRVVVEAPLSAPFEGKSFSDSCPYDRAGARRSRGQP